jgi:hypothetical protein
MSLTKVSFSMIADMYANVMDYGAVGDGIADDTAAFVAAQVASKNVYVPPGTYLIDQLRIQTGVQLIGAGYENTFLKQKTANQPAVNCLADVVTGFLSSLNLAKFTVVGHASASYPAVVVAAYGVYAIWKSSFDFVASLTYRALEVQGADANNVFRCDFKVSSQDTTNTAVVINGGTYNTFDLFLTNCNNGLSLDFTGLACIFIRSTSDGQQIYRGNETVVNNATVEQIPGTTLVSNTYPSAIVSVGFNETFINPYVILNTDSAAKVLFALSPFSNTVFINPKVFAPTLNNPIAANNAFKFSIIGPGDSNCVNKMETVFTDLNNANLSLRRVSFIGDCSNFVSGNLPSAGKVIQYLAPTTSFSFTVNNNTSAVIWEPTGTISACTLTLPQIPVDNQVLSFSTTQTLTAITVSSALPSGVNVSLVPTTMTANSQFSIIYYTTGNKWYRI